MKEAVHTQDIFWVSVHLNIEVKQHCLHSREPSWELVVLFLTSLLLRGQLAFSNPSPQLMAATCKCPSQVEGLQTAQPTPVRTITLFRNPYFTPSTSKLNSDISACCISRDCSNHVEREREHAPPAQVPACMGRQLSADLFSQFRTILENKFCLTSFQTFYFLAFPF